MGELYGAAEMLLDRGLDLPVGGVEQPVSTAASNRANTLAQANRFATIWKLRIMIANLLDEYPMLLFVFEAVIALGLLLFIVLWTGGGKK
jgi:hypothetical protein